MLGVIGGMGPLASSLFYDMIIDKTDAGCDQDNLNMIICSDSGMPDRTGAILSGDEAKVAEVRDRILKDAKVLENAGCSALAVTCNTAHYFVNMVRDEVGIPFIHMIEETAKELAKTCKGKPVAILATDGTVKTRLYQNEFEKHGIVSYTPAAEGQKKVMSTIYDLIKQNKPADAELWAEIEKEIKDAGCEAAILACTELSVVKKELDLPEYYRDPMEIMADRCIEYYRAIGEIK